MKNESEKAKQMTITDMFQASGIDPAVAASSMDDLSSEVGLPEMQKVRSPENSSLAELSLASNSSGDSMRESGLDFETALAHLEQIVAELDSEVKLERALQLFEQGMKLSFECEKYLKLAEQRVEILKQTLDGTTITEPFKTSLLDIAEG